MNGFNTKGLLYSDFVLRLLPKKSIRILSARVGRTGVGFISIRIRNLLRLADDHGDGLAFRLMQALKEHALKSFDNLFHGQTLFFIVPLYLNEYLMGFHLSADSFVRPLIQMRHEIEDALNRLALQTTGRPLAVEIVLGGSRIPEEPSEGFYRSLFAAYCQARRGSGGLTGESPAAIHDRFERIIEEKALTPVYQPVIDLGTGGILGWEAFIRGPENGPFHLPSDLFHHAEAAGETLKLEALCLETVLSGLGRLDSGQLLFLNLHPSIFNDPGFGYRFLPERVAPVGLSPETVVIESAEPGDAASARPLKAHFDAFRKQGFKTALADVGAGSVGLELLHDIAPDYLKLSKILVRGIEGNVVKRKVVESLVHIARSMDAAVIAEGIETVTEMVSVIATGVGFGQGYYIARPGMPKPASAVAKPKTPSIPKPCEDGTVAEALLDALIKPCLEVTPDHTVKAVKSMQSDHDPMSCTVVVDQGTPVGILMNYRLNSKLSTPYGMSLYFEKPVSRLMDSDPLMVERSQPVEAIAKAAMQRDPSRIYDDIIVTRRGRLEGTVSVQKLLDHLAGVQVQIARGANPLTGLPGNVTIEREISRRNAARIPSSLLYLDLDNFKVYNDAYGFEKGDQLILMTARAIQQGATEAKARDTFVGHVGGDDFIVIGAPAAAETIARKIIELFEAAVPAFYSKNDLERGYIMGQGRDGTRQAFPPASLSIGIIDCAFEQPVSRDELSLRVAEIKKYAKSVTGNAYVRDRRPPLGAVAGAVA